MGNERDIQIDVKMGPKCFSHIQRLAAGQPADETQILEILRYIDRRYDCADFRMVCILRTLFCYSHLITAPTLEQMKRSVLGFKYWMSEPGTDSMCYWSENHQLLFATCEYLAGQLYPQELFANNHQTGCAHRKSAEQRLNLWFETRFSLGFVEWHSNTYYEEDVAPLSLLIDCCQNDEIRRKATLLLDLALLDLALHSYRGFFCATSGRCYEAQKKDVWQQDVLEIAEKAFGLGNLASYDYTRLSADFVLNQHYRVPPVLKAIAHHPDPVEINDSMGLDLAEVKAYFAQRPPLDRGLYLWSMEAFTNPESAAQTLELWSRWNLGENDFLKNLSSMNRPIVRRLGLIPALIRLLNPVTQGIAIQRANSCTYKTSDFMLSTAQQYHPGEFGDQQHIWQATLSKGVTVFTTHPGAAFFEDNARNFSPSYWVGNGVLPHAGQHKNVCLCLYDLRVPKGLLEKTRQHFTHAWFPQAQFDQVLFCGPRLVCGRTGQGYIALHALKPLERRGNDELLQRGKVTGWAAVLGSAQTHGSFQAFVSAAQASELTLQGRTLTLSSQGEEHRLVYRRGLWVNGQKQNHTYPRLVSPYGNVPRHPQEYHIAHQGHSLHLAWQGLIREVN